jgi:hypothetical protein
MMVVVHSVSCVAVASQLQLPSSRSNGQQPIETSHLEAKATATAEEKQLQLQRQRQGKDKTEADSPPAAKDDN